MYTENCDEEKSSHSYHHSNNDYDDVYYDRIYSVESDDSIRGDSDEQDMASPSGMRPLSTENVSSTIIHPSSTTKQDKLNMSILKKMLSIQENIEGILRNEIKTLKSKLAAQNELIRQLLPIANNDRHNIKVPKRRSSSLSSSSTVSNKYTRRALTDNISTCSSYASSETESLSEAWVPSSGKAGIPMSPCPLPGNRLRIVTSGSGYNYTYNSPKKHHLRKQYVPSQSPALRQHAASISPRKKHKNSPKKVVSTMQQTTPKKTSSSSKRVSSQAAKKKAIRTELEIEVSKILKEISKTL